MAVAFTAAVQTTSSTLVGPKVYDALAIPLGIRPETQERAFSVRSVDTCTVPPEATTGSVSVGSAPLVVKWISAPGSGDVITTLCSVW